jgi:hypothetical protein
VNGGFSCPNIDKGESCTFCDNVSFSPAALKSDEVVNQFQRVRDRNINRYNMFIAYLQPNTNTYAPLNELKNMYESLIEQDGVIGLAIGTRPDSISNELYDYLEELNKKTYLSIELGLQSSNDSTLKRIQRGHTFKDFVKATEKLTKRGIEVVAHVMTGLPGESFVDTVKTVTDLSKLPIKGIKIHQLMVIKDTVIEEQYNKGIVKPLTIDEHGKILIEMFKELRPDIYIHRIMADAKPKFGLIAPDWSAEKDKSMMYLQKKIIAGLEQ